ncbi:MAG: tetratricopeptide repeat protein [Magnetococcales bacterium]|nr:tetratricopeptide repeat protein [Magnetococcales bacterium]
MNTYITYYAKVSEYVPPNSSVFGMLGYLYYHKGDYNKSTVYYLKAIEINPNYVEAYNNLGNAYKNQGKLDEGVKNLQKAISINPAFAEAYNNLGNIKLEQDKLDEAVVAFQNAITINPDYVMAYSNLGNAKKIQGAIDQAVALYQKAISLSPDYPDAHYNLGVALQEQNKLVEATISFQKAISLKPDFAAALSNLGNIFQELNRLDEAVTCYKKAILIDPNYVEAYSNLGAALKDQLKLDEAVLNCKKAISLNPDYAEAHNNLGASLQGQGKIDEAITSFQQAIKISPQDVKFRYSMSYVQLLKGELKKGWANYNLRWNDKHHDFTRFFKHENKIWQGEPLKGKRLLVWDEQGVGDNIIFNSMVPDLLDRGAYIVLECDKRLISLFTRSLPTVTCIPNNDSFSGDSFRHEFDYFIPNGNLGSLLRQDIYSFPKDSGYLLPNSEQKASIRNRYLAINGGVLVGIAWYSKSDKYKNKSIKLTDLDPLLSIPGVTFVDLQYGDTAVERSEFTKKTGINIIHDDEINQKDDLDSFASQVAAMDLVVTISNTTAHMAGALGVPTFLMLGISPIWYWMLDRPDSVWYSSLCLFRQKKMGEWADVIKQVSNATKDLLNKV